mmetsp:Transcript_32523/g.85413  ORF Transcript_32523/g.85413 Transcript_32523/m.85413 type:complete len:243 (+) Transcript_32523:971-1699(+)
MVRRRLRNDGYLFLWIHRPARTLVRPCHRGTNRPEPLLLCVFWEQPARRTEQCSWLARHVVCGRHEHWCCRLAAECHRGHSVVLLSPRPLPPCHTPLCRRRQHRNPRTRVRQVQCAVSLPGGQPRGGCALAARDGQPGGAQARACASHGGFALTWLARWRRRAKRLRHRTLRRRVRRGAAARLGRQWVPLRLLPRRPRNLDGGCDHRRRLGIRRASPTLRSRWDRHGPRNVRRRVLGRPQTI